ncbi:EamA family transporter [Aliarcobacter butzleri]|uniref:EamA family transporter n=2 Tax=Aliarcobacter butzleri TaxID=28197 RepID=UPI003B211198
MSSLAISLLSSLLVGFYIKSLKISFKKDLFIFIFSNYLTAIFLSYFLFHIQIQKINFELYNYKLIAITGFLLPTILYFLNKSLETSGLARTDIFQRLSLIIPIILSFVLFGEHFSYNKAIVIVLTFISIFLILGNKGANSSFKNIYYLFAVFLGYGIVDTLFKQIAINKSADFITTLFLIFICSVIVSLFYIFIFKGKINFKYFFLGIFFGILNFSNIYFYIKAHKAFAQSPTLVFITMNLGVIIGGTLIGRFYFKEKLYKSTIYGIFIAISSIILLALIQLKIW